MESNPTANSNPANELRLVCQHPSGGCGVPPTRCKLSERTKGQQFCLPVDTEDDLLGRAPLECPALVLPALPENALCIAGLYRAQVEA